MGIAFVHYFKTDVGAVQYVRPGADDATLAIQDGLVEVESVQVERHRGNTHCGEPDADYRPRTQEEVQGTAVVEGRILEDQPTEVAVGCNDVVGFFFLTEFVTVVLGLNFRGFT
ncbi:MAG: hypothetical protein RLZZ490_2572, partial [Cyanobacteriota bacterium]